MEKLFRKKFVFFFIKKFSDFWIKVLENQFLNHFLYNASFFESRISNASHFEPFFHNSTNLESKVLERSRFREKKLQRIRFWSEIDLWKNRFWWKFRFQKFTFVSFYPKIHQIMQLCVFPKTNNCFKKGRKTDFYRDVWKKIRFWNKFLRTRQIRIKFFKKEPFLVNFTQLVFFLYRKFYSGSTFETSYLPHIRFGTEVLTTQQIFTWNWFRNIKLSWTFCFQSFFCQFIPLKCQSWRFPTFLENLFLRAMFLEKNMLWIENSEKNQILNQFFCNASDF